MLDDIPFEIKSEIMKRVPVKSLLQFRSVSKTWKSLIDSSDFIACYRSQQQHLLIRYARPDEDSRYYSIVDDDTFPSLKFSVTIPVKHCTLIGCSNGLLCFCGDFQKVDKGDRSLTGKVVIWNMSIRKEITSAVVVPSLGFGMLRAIGFGVCCETSDSKIVKITFNDTDTVVEVFTLSTGAWMRSDKNLFRESIQFAFSMVAVAVDGVLYWLANDRIGMDGGFRGNSVIILFDLTSEEFKEVNIPDNIAKKSNIDLSVLRESLVVLQVSEVSGHRVCVVWMLENGFPESFTKLFSIKLPECAVVRGFRKSGEPIFEILKPNDFGGVLGVYEPNSKKLDNLGIDKGYSCSVFPYMETLLLLDKPDLMVYNDV